MRSDIACRKIGKLSLVCVLLVICLGVSGCSKLAPGKGNKNYILPTSKQVDDYIRTQNITHVISIDAIDSQYANILYKVGQNGIGAKVVTTLYGKVRQISDGKTIYGEKMPGVDTGASRGEVNFRYIYLNDSIARAAKEFKLVYYDDEKNEDIEIVEAVNDRNCFIYVESQYKNIVRGFKSISVYGENGEELNIK